MSYRVTIQVDVKIKNTAKDQFFDILRKLAALQESYHWVEPGFESRETMEDALGDWGFYGAEQGDFFVVSEFKSGENDALGDTCKLWPALAPVVEDGGFVNIDGGADEEWRYEFTDGKMHTVVL